MKVDQQQRLSSSEKSIPEYTSFSMFGVRTAFKVYSTADKHGWARSTHAQYNSLFIL